VSGTNRLKNHHTRTLKKLHSEVTENTIMKVFIYITLYK